MTSIDSNGATGAREPSSEAPRLVSPALVVATAIGLLGLGSLFALGTREQPGADASQRTGDRTAAHRDPALPPDVPVTELSADECRARIEQLEHQITRWTRVMSKLGRTEDQVENGSYGASGADLVQRKRADLQAQIERARADIALLQERLNQLAHPAPSAGETESR